MGPLTPEPEMDLVHRLVGTTLNVNSGDPKFSPSHRSL
jgi:hypothetical protein